MSDDTTKDLFSRRKFLESGSSAIAAAGMLASDAAAQGEKQPAFANTNGGSLLIGVNDDGQVLGLDKDYASMGEGGRDKLERHLRQLAKDKFGLSYTSTRLECDFYKINGLEICKMTIHPAPEPIVIKVVDKNGQTGERRYIRNGNASQELPVSEMHNYIKHRFALTPSNS
jgi:predicted HTH transcriptional regulator